MRNKTVFPYGFLGANSDKVAVYKIVAPNGSVYIGRSRNVFNRIRDHAILRGRNEGLNNSILIHGWAKHYYRILHELPKDISDTVLDDYEELYLEQYRNAGFNILNEYSARQGIGRRISAKAKIKMREQKIGRKQDPAHTEKIRLANTGKKKKPCSEERKRKISESLKGATMPLETRLKISQTMRNKNRNVCL